MESQLMEVRNVSINDIQPYERNNKKHGKKHVKHLADSIDEFGWTQPICVDENGVILAGHGRYYASKERGDVEVPVYYKHGLNDEQKKAYRLIDNKLSANPDWDMDNIKEEMFYLEDSEIDLVDELLNEFLEEEEASADEDDFDPEQVDGKKLLIEQGDLIQLGNHRLLCGDSTQLDNYTRLFGEQKASMIFTDPPYNVDYTGKTKDALKIENDKKTDSEFRQFLTDMFKCCAEYTLKGGAIYVCHADSEGYNFRGAFIDAGFLLKQCLIWVKQTIVLGRQDYHWKHEPILYGWLDGASHKWYGDRKQSTVWEVDRPMRNAEHPTMKPIKLVEMALANSSKKGDIVLDSFLGSGSTLIACEQMERYCYGMELDPKYAQVIVARWLKATHATEVTINDKTISASEFL